MNYLALVLSVNMISLSMSCSCVPLDLDKRFCGSDGVIKIIVTTNRREAEEADEEDGLVYYGIQVLKVYKAISGLKEALDKDPKIWTQESSATCGQDFDKDGQYIIAGHYSENKLMISACGFTRRTSEITEDEKTFFDGEYNSIKCD